MTRPRSDRLDAYFDCLAANCPPAMQAWIASTEREFMTAVERALDIVLSRLESGARRTGAMDALTLAWFLLELLASASIPTVLEEHEDGHVHVTVRHPTGTTLSMHGICTVYGGDQHHRDKCSRLLGRCTSGRAGRAFCLTFFRSPSMYDELQTLRAKWSIDRPLMQIGEAMDHASKCAFVTRHRHVTAALVEIVHLGCNLFSAEPTEKPDATARKVDGTTHVILFLAANPVDTDRRSLDREARAIQVELERSGHRDCFEFVTCWATEPLDLLRQLRRLKPTVVHFSGHRMPRSTAEGIEVGVSGDEHGLFFHGPDGRAQLVPATALGEAFGAAGSTVKVIVLSACYSDTQVNALLGHVGCVIGIKDSITDDAARNFAIGFYGGLGERESVAAAFRQGCAAIGLAGVSDGTRPQLKVLDGVDASQLVLIATEVPRTVSGR